VTSSTAGIPARPTAPSGWGRETTGGRGQSLERTRREVESAATTEKGSEENAGKNPGKNPGRIREESGKNIGILPGNIPKDLQFEKKKLVMITRVVRPVEPSFKFGKIGGVR
jgi:hypothetical protein